MSREILLIEYDWSRGNYYRHTCSPYVDYSKTLYYTWYDVYKTEYFMHKKEVYLR